MEIFENFFEKFFYFFQKKFGFFEKKCYICIIKNEKKKERTMKRKNRYSKVTNAMILEELRKIRQCRNAEEYIALKKAERRARRIKIAKKIFFGILKAPFVLAELYLVLFDFSDLRSRGGRPERRY